MSKFPDLKNPIHFIASLGGIGKIPIAPGTWGSLFAFLVFIYISHYVDMLIVVILSIPFSVWICEKASRNLVEKDHKSIVIDELVGIWIALVPALYLSTQTSRTSYAVLALIFFRLFDILKPYPVSYFDNNFKNGLGIVLDDLIAGIMAIFPAMALIYLLS
jgi:phosphatidylglycerophosphatase A